MRNLSLRIPASASRRRAEVSIQNPNNSTELGESLISILQKDAPQLNYQHVVNALAPKDFRSGIVMDRTAQQYLNYSQIIYRTPTEVIQKFFVWKAASELSSFIDSPPTNAYTEFRQELAGQYDASLLPRWRSCVHLIDGSIDWTGVWDGPSGLAWILSSLRVLFRTSYVAYLEDV
ncbi:Ff.00g117560.m01.CDS01 [Fusarium sp. VM40]|nr:Ff.00g117560.m01.CDS01 [Fusarium sp. VM40]